MKKLRISIVFLIVSVFSVNADPSPLYAAQTYEPEAAKKVQSGFHKDMYNDKCIATECAANCDGYCLSEPQCRKNMRSEDEVQETDEAVSISKTLRAVPPNISPQSICLCSRSSKRVENSVCYTYNDQPRPASEGGDASQVSAYMTCQTKCTERVESLAPQRNISDPKVGPTTKFDLPRVYAALCDNRLDGRLQRFCYCVSFPYQTPNGWGSPGGWAAPNGWSNQPQQPPPNQPNGWVSQPPPSGGSPPPQNPAPNGWSIPHPPSGVPPPPQPNPSPNGWSNPQPPIISPPPNGWTNYPPPTSPSHGWPGNAPPSVDTQPPSNGWLSQPPVVVQPPPQNGWTNPPPVVEQPPHNGWSNPPPVVEPPPHNGWTNPPPVVEPPPPPHSGWTNPPPVVEPPPPPHNGWTNPPPVVEPPPPPHNGWTNPPPVVELPPPPHNGWTNPPPVAEPPPPPHNGWSNPPPVAEPPPPSNGWSHPTPVEQPPPSGDVNPGGPNIPVPNGWGQNGWNSGWAPGSNLGWSVNVRPQVEVDEHLNSDKNLKPGYHPHETSPHKVPLGPVQPPSSQLPEKGNMEQPNKAPTSPHNHHHFTPSKVPNKKPEVAPSSNNVVAETVPEPSSDRPSKVPRP